ncbi:MAG: NAD-dependent epimerase/dehydratase family protein [Pseudomonadota bacterium]
MTVSSLSTGLHVVLGAGPAGRAVARALIEQDARVRIVSRSGSAIGLPSGVETHWTDLSKLDKAKDAMADASVVYHCAAPPYQHWIRDFENLQDSIVDAVSGTAARLVVLDNLYGYGVNGVLTEALPYKATGPKGRLRARMAAKLLDDHNTGRISVTIARASDFIGPEVRVASLGERFWPQLLEGKTVQWFGNPEAAHSYTYVPDLAAAMIELGSQETALGRVWHVPSLAAISLADLAHRAEKLAGAPNHKIAITPKITMRLVGLFVPAAGEMIEVGYQFDRPFVLSSKAYRQHFKTGSTDLETALTTTIDWWRDQAGAGRDAHFAA